MEKGRKSADRLDRYYTPEPIANALAEWAIQNPGCRVLDPSFGGCSFFHAAIGTLKRLGAKKPGKLLHGVDIDPEARQNLEGLSDTGIDKANFLTADFLGIRPERVSNFRFQAVLGNPPYTRHHLISDKFKLRDSLNLGNGSRLSTRASFWAYFVLHSLDFVASQGRLALVLPGAFLHADYAEAVRKEVLNSFQDVTVILVKERLFSEVEESSVLLLAAGRGLPNRSLRVGIAQDTSDVTAICQRPEKRTQQIAKSASGKQWLRSALNQGALELYSEIESSERVAPLRSYCSILIGVVTGCNRFFIIRESERRLLRIPRRLVSPILNRAKYLQGLTFNESDFRRLASKDVPAELLAVGRRERLPLEVRRYLSQGRKKKINEAYKCSSRKRWYCLDGIRSPQAFLHYMSASLPHIVLNNSSATCTNTVHQLHWKTTLSSDDRKRVSLASISTLFQLSAELNGRSYGGGVLKLEPSEAGKLLLVSPQQMPQDVAAHFSRVDYLLRSGQRETAIALADKYVLSRALGLSRTDVSTLRDALDFLVSLRLPGRP